MHGGIFGGVYVLCEAFDHAEQLTRGPFQLSKTNVRSADRHDLTCFPRAMHSVPGPMTQPPRGPRTKQTAFSSRNFAATSPPHANLRRFKPMRFPAALILGLAVILDAVARAPAVSVQVRFRFFTVVQSDDERQKKRVIILAHHLASSRCTSDPV